MTTTMPAKKTGHFVALPTLFGELGWKRFSATV
jgi:hypothetical protein